MLYIEEYRRIRHGRIEIVRALGECARNSKLNIRACSRAGNTALRTQKSLG